MAEPVPSPVASPTPRTLVPSIDAEWLEADGLGGFASGTVGLTRTRRYHALLLASARPPAERFVLVGGLEVWARHAAGRYALSQHEYASGVTHPDGGSRIASFTIEPWPTWEFACEDGTRIRQEICAIQGMPRVVVRWSLLARGRVADGRQEDERVVLEVRPLLAGRDFHALHHENPAARLLPRRAGDAWVWCLYDGVPGVAAHASGPYIHEPTWYRDFLYRHERDRGFDATEDLAAPGVFHLDVSASAPATLVLSAQGTDSAPPPLVPGAVASLLDRERARRDHLGGALDRAAEQYLVRRGDGSTIIAGYPWFGDWGRDTFIAMRGLFLARGRLEQARSILLAWAGAVDRGMLPNRFPDHGETPEYNSVDAALWYMLCVHEFLSASDRAGLALSAGDRAALEGAVRAILSGHISGTRHGIGVDSDALLRAGEAGVQLTWMDARVGERVITPRIGKPVEVQALWLNALHAAGRTWDFGREHAALLARGLESFNAKFWHEAAGCLYDVVDDGHTPGRADPAIRPNQLLAVGGLPLALVEGERARRVVDVVERRLMTPLGPRSLDPSDPAYAGRYEGGPAQRDAVYHQGTVWPWLLGPFVEAWVRVRGSTPAAKDKARRRFLTPIRAHLGQAGLGHVSEIADAEPPHTPRGCPFQAWSLGELVRLERTVLQP